MSRDLLASAQVHFSMLSTTRICIHVVKTYYYYLTYAA